MNYEKMITIKKKSEDVWYEISLVNSDTINLDVVNRSEIERAREKREDEQQIYELSANS